MQVKLILKKGAKNAQVFRLKAKVTVVGRQKGCTIRIPSSEVSRKHCRLLLKEDVLVVEDLDSVNGTFVNGERIRGKQILNEGDTLQVGPVIFVSEIEAGADGALEPEILPEEPAAAQVDVERADVEPASADVDPLSALAEIEQAPMHDETTERYDIVEQETKTLNLAQIPTRPDEPEEDAPDASLVLKKRVPLNENIRDILSQMEDS